MPFGYSRELLKLNQDLQATGKRRLAHKLLPHAFPCALARCALWPAL